MTMTGIVITTVTELTYWFYKNHKSMMSDTEEHNAREKMRFKYNVIRMI